jgi:8-amino-7-oxononanoate synthase
LISGNLDLHEALERELAKFLGFPSALLFSTGYLANLGLLTALAGPEDVIVSDALNHASIIDGCRLSQAQTRIFRHNDPEDLARVAAELSEFRRRILALDGVYSMDGDVARLRELVPIARSHEMIVILDDTHGTGILGSSGRGTTEHEGDISVDAQVGNLGKALGSFGGYIACSETIREYLVNRARSFIFTCGLAPGPVGAAREALRIVQVESWRRETLLERARQLRTGLRGVGLDTGLSTTQIVPLIFGEEQRVMRVCEAALRRGVYAQGIRYPSVPRGTARIRVTPMCSHSPEEIATTVQTFAELTAPADR